MHTRVCARFVRGERNGAIGGKVKGRRRHDTSFGGYRLNCSLNAVPDLLIIAAAAGYLYYYPLSICHFIFLLENHPCDFYSPPPPRPRQHTDQKHREQITRSLFSSSSSFSFLTKEYSLIQKNAGIPRTLTFLRSRIFRSNRTNILSRRKIIDYRINALTRRGSY